MDEEWKKLARITIEVDPDVMALIPAFLARKQTDLETLRNALKIGDLAAVGSLGHRIKGEGGSFGFEVMSEIGAALEAAGKKADAASAARLLADLSSYLEKLDVIAGPES